MGLTGLATDITTLYVPFYHLAVVESHINK